MKTLLRGLCLMLGLSCLIGFGADIPSVEKLLPQDTLLLVTTPDFSQLRSVYRNSPQARFWNDPAMQPFRQHFIARMNEQLLQPLERDLGIKLDDYTNLPQGQITFALTQDASAGQPLAFLLLLDARSQGAQLTKDLAELRKKWVAAGKVLQTERIRDTEFSAVPISEKDLPGTLRQLSSANTWSGAQTNGGSKTRLFIGQFDSLLIVGNSTQAIEKVLVHLSGGAVPSLGDLAAYDSDRLALFRQAPIYAWLNTKLFMNYLVHAPSSETNLPEDPFPSYKPARILAALGLDSLKTIAVSAQLSADGSLVKIFLKVPESGRQGLFKILPSQTKDSGPPPFVPADVVKFQRCRIDGQKAWSTLENVAGQISPQAVAGINSFFALANSMNKAKDPDYDLKKSLIGNLGDDLVDYQKAPRGQSAADLSSPPSLFLIGSPQPAQLAAALKNVLVFLSQGATPSERDFLGRKIYTVQLPPLQRRSANGSVTSTPRSLSYAASGGYVALSTDASMLEEFLRSGDSQQKTLRQLPGLNDAIAQVGGSATGWLGYENEAQTTRAIFEMLRKNAPAQTAAAPALMAGGIPAMNNMFRSWMDYSLLPPFDQIAKYFYFTVYTCGADVNGITFKMFAPTPPALRR